MVNAINNKLPFTPTTIDHQQLPKSNNLDGEKTVKKDTLMDQVTLTKSTESPFTYSSSLASEKIDEKGYEMLRRLVASMLKEQGIDYRIATGSSTIDITTISQEEAQELIADDGYFGVEQTSDRIVNFAIAAVDGDPSKLDVIKESAQKGFNEAREIFGGALPEISYKTLDAIMKKLDVWAAETNSHKT